MARPCPLRVSLAVFQAPDRKLPMNAVVLAVGVMLALSLCRVHVVVALIVGAVAGGLAGGLSLDDTLQAFQAGLGKGATVALSYALLGAFAVAIAKSGTAHALADRALGMINGGSEAGSGKLRLVLLVLLLGAAIASQNILPIHIAFIPLDRKSTRLNSSHVRISYAVFCLKKK